MVRISVTSSDLKYVEPDLFRVVGTLQDCHLSGCTMTRHQLSTIFSTLRDTADLKLRNLDLSVVNLSSLEPGLLQSVIRLESCCLEESPLTAQQVSVIFRSLQETPVQDLKLRVLELSNVDLSSVDLGMIESVVKLESLTLKSVSHSFLATDTAFFKAILEAQDLKLRSIDVGGNCFVGVPRTTLVWALARLEKVSLTSVHLSTSQLLGIFKLAAGWQRYPAFSLVELLHYCALIGRAAEC